MNFSTMLQNEMTAKVKKHERTCTLRQLADIVGMSYLFDYPKLKVIDGGKDGKDEQV